LNVTGVVVALGREARALGPAVELKGHAGVGVLADGTLRAVSGMGSAAAGMAARRLIQAGATALVSWGLAGGLDPGLEAGAIVLPREVVAADGMRFATSAAWRETLTASIASYRPVAAGALLTSPHPIAGVAAKAAARRETGAVAVDMESSAVAEVAAASHVPLMAVRVIVDTALDVIPRSVTRAGDSGEVSPSKLLLELARAPGDVVPLLRLALRYRAAIGSLRAVGKLGALAPPAVSGGSGAARFRETVG
jgi:adenosylhomocysteine nucleosidase